MCLACRNKGRAEAARQSLLVACPEADITIILVDVSCVESVYKAAYDIKHKLVITNNTRTE